MRVSRHEAITLQNLPIMLCCNSFEMSLLCSAVYLLCSHYAQFFNKGGVISAVHSGESKLFIATVVTQLPEILQSITSYTGC